MLPGRALDGLVAELPPADVERLVVDAGELLARVHGVAPDRGTPDEPAARDPDEVERAIRTARDVVGPRAAAAVERGAEVLRGLAAGPPPRAALAHGDFLPKHLLVDGGGGGRVVGVIDWEFAGPASPALDLARWEISAGDPLHDRSDLLRRGYARVADPDEAGDGWVPVFALGWAIEVLGWRDPASPARIRRCVEVVARHAGA